MPPASRRRSKRRSAEIVVAAAKVFAERGYHGATTQDIADVLGIRQASLYYYFPSKEAALEQVCMDGSAGYVAGALAVKRGPGSAAEKLARLVSNHVELWRTRVDFARVFLRERSNLPKATRHRIGRYSRRYERIFEDVLQAGMDSGEFRPDLDPRITALAVIGMCNSATAWYGIEPGATVERIAADFVRLLVDGILAGAERRSA